jgi:hypothetical protein
MDINFVALVFGLGTLAMGFVTKKRIYNIPSMVAFIFLTVTNSDNMLLAVAFASMTVIAIADLLWVRE